MEKARFDMAATGRPYTDFFVDDDGEAIQRLGVAKGGSTRVDAAEMLALLSGLPVRSVQAGGSPSNTCAVVAALGGRAVFLGKTCDDDAGRLFRQAFAGSDVRFPTKCYSGFGAAVSGSCVILRSRDGIETMIHCPGVGDLLNVEDLVAEVSIDRVRGPVPLISDCAVFYVQAHLLFAKESRAAIAMAVELARASGRQVAFSLHDHQMNEDRARLFVGSFLRNDDVVLGNRLEFEQVFGVDLARYVMGQRLLVTTDGANGTVIRGRGQEIAVPAARPGVIVNTIGAGDAFAGGFLFGVARGLTVEQSVELGTACAGRILEVASGRPECDWSSLVRGYLDGGLGISADE